MGFFSPIFSICFLNVWKIFLLRALWICSVAFSWNKVSLLYWWLLNVYWKGWFHPYIISFSFCWAKGVKYIWFFFLANLVDCLEHQILISLLSCNCFVLISFWFSLMTRVHFYTDACVVLTVLEVIRKSLFCSSLDFQFLGSDIVTCSAHFLIAFYRIKMGMEIREFCFSFSFLNPYL